MTAMLDENKASEAGFTLVEMLVVLAILAITATFAAPLLSSGSSTLRLEMASGEMTAALRVTRSAAITRNAELDFLIDVDRRTFGSPAAPQRAFAPGIDVKLTFASGILTGLRGGLQILPGWIIDRRRCDIAAAGPAGEALCRLAGRNG